MSKELEHLKFRVERLESLMNGSVNPGEFVGQRAVKVPKGGEKYWNINLSHNGVIASHHYWGGVSSQVAGGDDYDRKQLACGNIFTSEEEAQRYAIHIENILRNGIQ